MIYTDSASEVALLIVACTRVVSSMSCFASICTSLVDGCQIVSVLAIVFGAHCVSLCFMDSFFV